MFAIIDLGNLLFVYEGSGRGLIVVSVRIWSLRCDARKYGVILSMSTEHVKNVQYFQCSLWMPGGLLKIHRNEAGDSPRDRYPTNHKPLTDSSNWDLISYGLEFQG
jgi:hypothetical protein